ncbi:MAG: secretin and TonB N-terminal domain-containing protein, partial [Bacteroidota bacterium]
SLSLRDVSVAEYLRAIGIQHQINLYIAETPGKIITHNLTDEKVKSVFLFLCKTFDFDIEVTGSILEFVPYEAPAVPNAGPKLLKISYEEGLLSVDLKNDSLYQVIRTISALTGTKIVAQPGLHAQITAFLPPTELNAALEALFLTNGFSLSARKKGYFVLQQSKQDPQAPNLDRLSFEVESFTDGDEEYISTHAENADLASLIKAIFERSRADYLIYDKLQGMVSISAEITRLEDVLSYVLQGTDYTYKRDGGIYLIGSKLLNGLQTTQTVRMRYRPTYQAIELIPGAKSSSSNSQQSNPQRQAMNRNPELNNNRNNNSYNNLNSPYSNNLNSGFSNPYGGGNGNSYTNSTPSLTASTPPEIRRSEANGVEIIDYPELNRIILKGPTDRVAELALFLAEIDRPVPMVKIEMVVVEINKDRMLSAGVSAGLRSNADSISQTKDVLPGIDYTLNGDQINAVTGAIPALSNLGVLNSNFYLQLQAQETNGNLKVKMQPVLSMLNGREASLEIGQSQYYLLETQTSNSGAVNNFQTFTQRFERIDANISLTLKPYVSDDGMVTLDIMPDFTTPVGQFSPDLPPTIATRRFVSTIRVKNGETVILGGLSEEAISDNSTGLPFLSRVPVLKWFFGKNSKGKQQSSLVIYITPVVYYH